MVNFLHLPPVALRLIFRQYNVYDPPLLVLNKSTLPHVLAAVYTNVQLKGRTHIRYFVAAVVHQPGLLEHVQSFGISDHACEDGYWEAAQKKKSFEELAAENDSYDPAGIELSIGLLALLSIDFLAREPLPKLQRLTLLYVSDDPHSPPDGYGALGRLSAFPALKLLEVKSFELRRVSLSSLNIMPSTHVATRSVNVDGVELAVALLNHSAAILFAALGEGCQHLTITAGLVLNSFARSIILLPTTLVELTLPEGLPCGFIYGSRPPRFFPTRNNIGRSLGHLVNLRHLFIYGDLLASEGFEAIPTLPHLHHLVFGAHVSLSLPQLLGYVDPDSPLHLHHFHLLVDVCECTNDSTPSRYIYTWPPSFSPQDGRRLLDKAAEAGVKIAGTIGDAVAVVPKWTPKNGTIGRKLLRKGR